MASTSHVLSSKHTLHTTQHTSLAERKQGDHCPLDAEAHASTFVSGCQVATGYAHTTGSSSVWSSARINPSSGVDAWRRGNVVTAVETASNSHSSSCALCVSSSGVFALAHDWIGDIAPDAARCIVLRRAATSRTRHPAVRSLLCRALLCEDGGRAAPEPSSSSRRRRLAYG